MNLYRIDVRYPTPDGHPFKEQPAEHYWAAVERWAGGNVDSGRIPGWLADIDFGDWVRGDDTDPYRYPHPVRSGYTILDVNGQAFLSVPTLDRRYYLVWAAAERAVQDLREWGAQVRITESEPITWKDQTDE